MTSSEVHESGLDMSHPVFKTLQPLVEALGCSVIDASLIEPADIPLIQEGRDRSPNQVGNCRGS